MHDKYFIHDYFKCVTSSFKSNFLFLISNFTSIDVKVFNEVALSYVDVSLQSISLPRFWAFDFICQMLNIKESIATAPGMKLSKLKCRKRHVLC